MVKVNGLKLQGFKGTWYEIDRLETVTGDIYILLESEQYGDDVSGVIINQNYTVIVDETYNDLKTELQPLVSFILPA
ncbi:hypothetical protein UFOVP451_50 [uncultured Caudovirales phage]|uniref:Large polyvalent protein-associated domain-containing protein n=1 Tax=uncultured Caudovirales phage TaxID=2100421 RepID=A0A6J5MAP7_9CAUD|nr:hypothetical protein UFOVP451_50 [uncultured Caudovirales phage]